MPALGARHRVRGPSGWSGVGSLEVEVDTDGDQHDQDGGGDLVDDQAERRPPPGVGHVVAAVLPEVLEPMAAEAEHQQPCRSGDAGRGEHDERCSDRGLDGDDVPPSVSYREADIDRRIRTNDSA
jgi:hypothetical protein